jgi:hypothetical protein
MYKVPNHPVFKSFGIMRLPSGTYICPGWIKVPDGTTREQVEWETPLPKSSVPEWSEHFVKGTTGDYKVTISEQFGDRCTCPGYGFRKKCRHIEEVKRHKDEI